MGDPIVYWPIGNLSMYTRLLPIYDLQDYLDLIATITDLLKGIVNGAPGLLALDIAEFERNLSMVSDGEEKKTMLHKLLIKYFDC